MEEIVKDLQKTNTKKTWKVRCQEIDIFVYKNVTHE